MLTTERAMLVHFESVRIVFLFLHCVVVSALALCANECDFCSYNSASKEYFASLTAFRLRGNFVFPHKSFYPPENGHEK